MAISSSLPESAVSSSQIKWIGGLSPRCLESVRPVSLTKTVGLETQDKIQFHTQQIKDLKKSLDRINGQKKQYLQKMNLLIGADSTPDEIKSFKSEFSELLKSVADEKRNAETQISQAEEEMKALKGNTFSWAEIEKHAQPIQYLLQENDPTALKRAYYGLFKAIIIGPEDDLGTRKLIYILKNNDELLEDGVRLRSEMVEAPGIEPGSASDPQKGATDLVRG